MLINTDPVQIGNHEDSTVPQIDSIAVRSITLMNPESNYLRAFRFNVPEPNAFNGSLVRTHSGQLLVYRTSPTCACIFLDDRLRILPSTRQILPLWRHEDPRVFNFQKRLFLTSSFTGSPRRAMERMELRRVLIEDKVVGLYVAGAFKTVHSDPSYTVRREKNWAPFEWQDELFFVHTVRPHRILRCDVHGASVSLKYETAWSLPHSWNPKWGSELRLNAPPLRFDVDTYLSTCHTFCRDGYRTWFYTFSAFPPFEVKSISERPVLIPTDATGRNRRRNRDGCIFITSMQIQKAGTEVLLTGGDNDHSVIGITFSSERVFSRLRPV